VATATVEVVVVTVVDNVVDAVVVVDGAVTVTVAMIGGLAARALCIGEFAGRHLHWVAPMQEQALEYLTAPEQADA
jgi:hypothetical protein